MIAFENIFHINIAIKIKKLTLDFIVEIGTNGEKKNIFWFEDFSGSFVMYFMEELLQTFYIIPGLESCDNFAVFMAFIFVQMSALIEVGDFHDIT